MPAIPPLESRPYARTGRIRKLLSGLAYTLANLRISEKIAVIVAALVLVMTLLMAMSIQSVRLQAEYRRMLTNSATAAINIERVNGLIYAIIMESRGIYMTNDDAKLKPYAEELLRHNRELANVVDEWERTVDFADEGQFPAFKQRIFQFIDFRRELVHRATTTGAAAARAWALKNSAPQVHVALNKDLEAFAKILSGRTMLVADLADMNRIAS